jgi:metal-responsive CopG/Arc/MetJ family transcriptional regulator
MKTAISIPDRLFEAAERLARQLGVSRSRLFQMAVASFLEEHRQDRVAEVDGMLKHLQGASIAREDW